MRSRIWLIITGTTWKVGTNIHVWSLTRPHLGYNQGDIHSGWFKPLLAPNKINHQSHPCSLPSAKGDCSCEWANLACWHHHLLIIMTQTIIVSTSHHLKISDRFKKKWPQLAQLWIPNISHISTSCDKYIQRNPPCAPHMKWFKITTSCAITSLKIFLVTNLRSFLMRPTSADAPNQRIEFYNEQINMLLIKHFIHSLMSKVKVWTTQLTIYQR